MDKKTTINRRSFVSSFVLGGAAGFMLSPTISLAQTVQGLYGNIPLKDEIMGNQNARVTLLEYASMTCPHCKAFHEKILPDIKKSYINTGRVKYVLRPFPFDGDRRGEAAFMLAKCAPNDNYYAMLDALFASQQNWAGKGNPVPELLRISKLSGMTESDFKACLSNQELLTRIIDGRNLAVQKFNVRSTPTVFINDQRFNEPATVENLSAALDGALAS
ncbi:MAG: thioredoxin domain-containing protein [Rhizobiaceae bacterium]|nr:thioredoxin domain-containing protein [Rhizobiaceae bacterium]